MAENPGWVNYRERCDFPIEEWTPSILARCASLGYTNHVRVLIKSGANVQDAIDWHEQFGSEDSVRIIQMVAEQDKEGVDSVE